MEASKSYWGIDPPKGHTASDTANPSDEVCVELRIRFCRSGLTGEYSDGSARIELPEALKTMNYTDATTIAGLAAALCERMEVLECIQGEHPANPLDTTAPPHVA